MVRSFYPIDFPPKYHTIHDIYYILVISWLTPSFFLSVILEAATRLVYFLAASKGETNGALTLWMTGGIGLPAQTANIYAVLFSPAFKDPPLAFMKLAASEAMNNPIPAAITPAYAQIDTILQDTLAEVRAGGDPKQALDKAVQLVNKKLQ